MAIIELDDVRYSYSGGAEAKNVLQGVSCAFERRTFSAIIGKSGSGKSTLLNLIAGLDQPVSGRVLFEGTPTSDMNLDEYRRKSVAVIYQDFCLFPLLTALENILYPMELCKVEKKQAKEDALALAELVKLPEELLDRYPGKISGGEQQRVAIARALAMDRRLILADEPTGNLDAENSAGIITLLKSLAREQDRCVIVATHDISVMKSADRVYLMVDGRLEEADR
jgi:putative ABC transport system ATP-binding protein